MTIDQAFTADDRATARKNQGGRDSALRTIGAGGRSLITPDVLERALEEIESGPASMLFDYYGSCTGGPCVNCEANALRLLHTRITIRMREWRAGYRSLLHSLVAGREN